jgi:hypothetical protein
MMATDAQLTAMAKGAPLAATYVFVLWWADHQLFGYSTTIRKKNYQKQTADQLPSCLCVCVRAGWWPRTHPWQQWRWEAHPW